MSTWRELLAADAPFVVAHRGYSGRAPENTLPAFETAIEVGARALELDVRLTQDRVPVVFHDATLDRTTNGSGRVDAHDWEEISKLDAGSWFGPAFAGARVPLLETALAMLADRVLINVELKPDGYDTAPPPDALAHQVAHLVHKLRLEEQVVVSCFDPRHVRQAHAAREGLQTSLLLEAVGDVEDAREIAIVVDAILVSPDADLLEADEVEALVAAGMPVVPYVANDAPTMRRLLDHGVAGFFSDEVELALDVIGGR